MQIIVVDPSTSTAGSFLISDLFLAILVIPIASVRVRTAGNPSGTAATARPIEKMNKSVIDSFLIKIEPRTNMRTDKIIIPIVSCLANFVNFF